MGHAHRCRDHFPRHIADVEDHKLQASSAKDIVRVMRLEGRSFGMKYSVVLRGTSNLLRPHDPRTQSLPYIDRMGPTRARTISDRQVDQKDSFHDLLTHGHTFWPKKLWHVSYRVVGSIPYSTPKAADALCRYNYHTISCLQMQIDACLT